MGGPGSGRSRRRTLGVVELDGGGGHEVAESLSRAPLFADLVNGEQDELFSVLVMRAGPVSEGAVGEIGPGDGIEEISKRWGGGKYRVQGRNSDGKPLKGAFKTLDIAGEPRFKSRAADLEYKRQLGVDLAPVVSEKTSSSPTSLDIVTILAKQAEDARVQFERRQLEGDAAHKRDMERLREEATIRERERRADEDRRDKDRAADEDRRRKDDEARDRRERQLAEESRARDREFYATMLKSRSEGGSPVDLLMTGVKLASELKGDGDGEGGMAAVVAQVLGGLAQVFAGRVAGAEAAPPPAVRVPQPVTVAPAVAPSPRRVSPVPASKPKDPKAHRVILAGAIGLKAERAIENLRKHGQDPEAVLASLLEQLASARPQDTEPATAPPPAPEPPAPDVAQEPKDPKEPKEAKDEDVTAPAL